MVWAAVTYTNGDVYGSNILTGVGGAIGDSTVQMTVVDLFYVHQRARMNAIYLLMVSIGTFLAPAAAGYCLFGQSRWWTNWWTVIFLGVLLACRAR
jgi:MFS family permease